MQLVPFVPSSQAPFQFQCTLDGNIYTCTITWSLFGRRYYLNIFDLNQNLVLTEALIGSPDGIAIQGLFWDQGVVTLSTLTTHGFRVGSTTELTISGSAPDAYNAVFQMLATGPQTLSFPLPNDPGVATSLGSVSYNIDLVGIHFDSTFVFRGTSQNFEISP
jgi:hypothetical protein